MLIYGTNDKTKLETIFSMTLTKICKLKLTIRIAAMKGKASIQSWSIKSKILIMLYGEVQKSQRHGASKTYLCKMDRSEN